ncbi:hypothetical protein BLOT_004995, partial [Blomia tropicalis]
MSTHHLDDTSQVVNGVRHYQSIEFLLFSTAAVAFHWNSISKHLTSAGWLIIQTPVQVCNVEEMDVF